MGQFNGREAAVTSEKTGERSQLGILHSSKSCLWKALQLGHEQAVPRRERNHEGSKLFWGRGHRKVLLSEAAFLKKGKETEKKQKLPRVNDSTYEWNMSVKNRTATRVVATGGGKGNDKVRGGPGFKN